MPKIFQKARDPISSYSHFIGAGLSVFGLAAMCIHLLLQPDVEAKSALSSILFCVSLIALYCTSGIYHFSMSPPRVILILRKLDHAMIYILIAGTYTPLLLNLLPYPNNVGFTTAIWCVAAAGILMKLCWMNAPRWLGTLLYLLMGWAILVDVRALTMFPAAGTVLLVTGGVLYTIGGIIYMLKRPNLTPAFGFHELFHLFVIAGSICHYFMVFLFIA